MNRPSPHDRRKHAREGGFSILEVLIAASVLGIALLGHTASIFSEHTLSKAQRARSTAILAAEQFVERLRSEDDWAGVYGRLNTLRTISILAGGGGAGALKTVATQAWFDQQALTDCYALARDNHGFLQDGRVVFPAEVYCDDFTPPSGLHTFHLLVDVPAAPLNTDLTGPPCLREDLPLPGFGLPADLNGDGAIDDGSHNDDCRAIPVIIHVRWTHSDAAEEELRIATWLWGYR